VNLAANIFIKSGRKRPAPVKMSKIYPGINNGEENIRPTTATVILIINIVSVVAAQKFPAIA